MLLYFLSKNVCGRGASRLSIRFTHGEDGKGDEMDFSNILNHADFTFAVCTFLDEFKRSSDKFNMIKDAPLYANEQKINLCLLAAITHRLANEYRLPVPAWVNDEKYIMLSPIFAYDTENPEYREYLIATTPLEFSSRNIYYGANVIERV